MFPKLQTKVQHLVKSKTLVFRLIILPNLRRATGYANPQLQQKYCLDIVDIPVSRVGYNHLLLKY